ncbi:aminopeptidases-like protein [Staphylothermus marinus F1]|uniref:Aminopeptidases-like protein n=1 Tax=Staphylothermus marinus (strain ATCC 43588 / DSM 3639 / JCM 9404 / F1) TaxID=399550 RepID=A3DL52_STAMF|nr:aminopeptidases-like protein [Staphylothermus marinus F1]
MINDFYRKIIAESSQSLVKDTLSIITRYHRLQGSSGLWNAVNELKEILGGLGLPAKTFRIEEGDGIGFIKAPISWDPIEAYIEIKIGDHVLARLDLKDHPTLLAAHSPGGEGCAELKVCGEKLCDGEAILVTGYLYDIYLNTDAKLILYYMKNRHPEAVPYTGLFLEPGDKMKGVVMNIPYSLALKIMSLKIENPRKKITVCWKAKINRHNKGLPILISCIGDDPGVVFISHICHPKPGAHDNASGSAGNLHVAYVLSQINPGFSYCNIWVPEYTGTVFLEDKLPWRPLSVINLDMIGSKQYITGSSLTLINPPRFMNTFTAPAGWIAMQKVFDTSKSFNNISQPGIRYGISPYTMGSDHDVFIVWGIDSIMYNEWPSKYYHTDKDTTETIDPEHLMNTSIASILTAYLILKSNNNFLEGLRRIYDSYLKTWYKSQAIKIGYSINYLSKYLVKKPLVEKLEEPLMKSPIFSRTLYHILGRARYLEIRKIPGIYTYLAVYAPLSEKIGLNNHVKHYKAELLIKWSRKEEKQVVDAWETIKSNIKI